ncbi:hypothetical protein M9458_023721, partial [Cirrhinus mrigala]
MPPPHTFSPPPPVTSASATATATSFFATSAAPAVVGRLANPAADSSAGCKTSYISTSKTILDQLDLAHRMEFRMILRR